MAGVDLAVPTLLVLLHLVPRTVAGTTDDEAAAALLAFKRASVSADPHGALSGWRDGTSASPCAWAGVSCAATDGRVRALNLSGMSLAGRLHLGALLALPALRSLDLRGNAFHGNLSHRASPSRRIAPPPCALVDVDLSSNALKGALPWAFLASCGNLRSLNLSRNSLSGGGFPFPPSLRTLDMSRNNFSGDISVFLGGFQQLKKLALAGNNFTGEIPDELGLLSGTLVELDLSSNQLIGGLPPSFSRCRSLMVLDLSGNQLSGDFVVTVISKISSLRVLRLPFNNITGRNPLPTLVAGCPLLEVIDLGSNMLNGEIMPELCSSLPSLRKLLLPNNFLTGTVPLSLGICSNLESLDLSFNLLVGQIPAEVILLPKLVDLAMWANDLSGEIPDMLCSSSITLETLVLSYNHFTGGIPASITRCVNLIWVSLAGNSLTGSVPSGFGKLQKLAILQLHKNSLSGPVPAELGSCNSLVWLDLSSNNFSGAIPPQLAAQAGLTTGGVVSGKRIAFLRSEVGNICPGAGVLFEFFGIRTERLAQLPAVRSCAPTGIYTGTIFYTFNSNGSMIFLDLSYNHLTGTIPTSLGNMAYLDVLNLGHNELTGEIPGAFTGLEEIALLDLSHNQLSGTIPPGFGGLHFLAAFDVSNNNLAGEIPTSGQLMTFPASGFENNSGLCGIPLPPCRGIDNKGGGGLVPEDIRDGHEPVVSPSGLGIGVAFGVPVGFGLGILLL